MVFDPFTLAARFVSEKLAYRAVRITGGILFAGLLALRLRQYEGFLLKPLWVAESLVFVVLFAAFLVRSTPVDRAPAAPPKYSSHLPEASSPLRSS